MATVGGDPMTGREYQTEIPGVSRTTQVFKPFLSEAKVCQENVSELDANGNAITTSGKIFVYQEYPKPFPNMTDVYDYGFDQAPGITYGTTAQNVMYATCAAPVTGYARHTHTDYVEFAEYLEYTPAGENIPISQLRTLPAAVVVKDGSGSRQSETRYFYDGQGGTGVCSYSPPLASAAGITMHDDEKYGVGSTTPRGNQTCAAQWLNTTPEQWLTTKTQFDIAGNAVRVEDARGNPTQYGYETNCSFGPSNTYAFPTAITNALNQTTTIQYDCGLGKPDKITDANNRKTTFTYGFNDPLDRLTSYTEAFGEQAARTTDYVYTPTPPYYGGVTTRLDATKAGVHTAVEYDGLGRERASLLYDGESIVSQVDTKYNAQGLIWKVSNPHTGGASAVTETLYDGAGRVVTVKRPGNSAATTSYAAVGGTTPLRTTTMTDEASSSRVLYYDAFGRLQRLVEDPGVQPHLNYETTYAYDALGNLTDAVQGGQTRHFTYDSLGRLLSATNPESGTTAYSYDESGNLVRKIAAGGVATCFWPSAAGGCSASALYAGGYDALNRPIVKHYSDGTPAVKWCYDGNTYLDGACQGGEVQGEKGLLTAVGNYVSSGGTTWTISSTEYKHQALGLVKWSKQVTGGQEYTFDNPTNPGEGYVYDNGGRLTAMWYPSGRKVTYEYDGAGRVNVVGGQLGTNTLQYTSASNKISYAPHGAPVSVTFGNGLQETVRFNERLQPDLMQAGSLWKLENFYCPDGALSCASNNGNVVSQRLTAPKTAGGSLVLNTAYGYDGVNRLESALESKDGSRVWKDLYTYTDGAGAGGQYGNLRVSAATGGYGGGTPDDLKCGSYDASTNRCTGGFQYDNGASGGPGNITAFPGDRTAAYDAENRQTTLTEVTQGITSTW
jgi:YD repeat-containing protein